MRKALLLLPVLGLVGSAQAGSSALPPPSLRLPGHLQALTASGPVVAVAAYAQSRCGVTLVTFGTRVRSTPVRGLDACRSGDAEVDHVFLSRTSIGATVVYSPSPHGDTWTYWSGPRPSGPLRRVGESWGWTDSDVPMGYGCARAVVAGGGAIVSALVPNRLAVEQGLESTPACLRAGRSEPLATDGKRLVTARLDAEGRRTGALELLDRGGRKLPFEQPDPPLVRAATAAWLTPAGLILQAQARRLYGPGWITPPARAATVGEGRVVYVTGNALRVRRTSGAPDRLLLRLPRGEVLLAAGSGGVVVATDQGGGTVSLHRLPWRRIDRTLTAG